MTEASSRLLAQRPRLGRWTQPRRSSAHGLTGCSPTRGSGLPSELVGVLANPGSLLAEASTCSRLPTVTCHVALALGSLHHGGSLLQGQREGLSGGCCQGGISVHRNAATGAAWLSPLPHGMT